MQEGHFIKHDRSLPLKSVHIYLTLSANKVKKHWQIQKIATHKKKHTSVYCWVTLGVPKERKNHTWTSLKQNH